MVPTRLLLYIVEKIFSKICVTFFIFWYLYKNHRFILHPENEDMEDIIVEGNLQIQGVAVRVLKEVI